MRAFFYYAVTTGEAYKEAVIACDLDKLDVFGDEYIYIVMRKQYKELLYKEYVTDTLRMIAEGKSYPVHRYADVINPKPDEPELSAEEIVEQVNKRAGLTMIEEGDEANERI